MPVRRPNARLRLFCFSYAGGWPWVFRDWVALLPPDVELSAICLPGRGRRNHRPAVTDMVALVAALRDAMSDCLDRPFAFFGHSLGALIAFELAGELARRGYPAPRRLFVSGCAAPTVRRSSASMRAATDEELLRKVRDLNGTPHAVLENRELLAMTLPLLRADFELGDRYEPRTTAVDCPVTAIFGIGDNHAPRDDVAAWREHASGPFVLRGLPGDHFFLHSHAPDLLAVLQRDLQ